MSHIVLEAAPNFREGRNPGEPYNFLWSQALDLRLQSHGKDQVSMNRECPVGGFGG